MTVDGRSRARPADGRARRRRWATASRRRRTSAGRRCECRARASRDRRTSPPRSSPPIRSPCWTTASSTRACGCCSPCGLLGLVLIALCLLTADRISKALTDLAERAKAIVRASGEPVPEGGDELIELGAAHGPMSSELSIADRRARGGAGRLKETLHRYGETLAATHDLNALSAPCWTPPCRRRGPAAAACCCTTPNAERRSSRRGSAPPAGRAPTCRWSCAAGHRPGGRGGLGASSRASSRRRGAMLAVPILREHQLLGLVTMVDPEDGGVRADDIETLSGTGRPGRRRDRERPPAPRGQATRRSPTS